MNIFVLDRDPHVAAIQQCDQHISKMCLETAQMLCTALHRHGVEARYKPTHVNHPCTLWAGENRSNYTWLCDHGLSLCREYTSRFRNVHLSESVIWQAKHLAERVPGGVMTPFAQAMPEQYKSACAVESYRQYYANEKLGFATWRRNMPEWVVNHALSQRKENP